MNAGSTSEEQWCELIDRLSATGVRYLMGGSTSKTKPASYENPAGVPVAGLLLELARCPEARLRDAMCAVLLAHPEDAESVEATARALSHGDPAGRLMLLSILVAAALQREWSFSLGIYISGYELIDAGHLSAEFGVPSPDVDYGRVCLAAVARFLRSGDSFPYNYQVGWEDSARRLLAKLAGEARSHGT